MFDQVFSEDVTMGVTATPTDSTRTFTTVTKITMPARGASGDTISVGPGAALGLDAYCDAHPFRSFYDASGVFTHTRDADESSKNTVTLDATLDGSSDQAIVYSTSTFPEYNRIWG